jgi:hypothetical protein
MVLKYCHEVGVRDYRRGMDLQTTCIHHSELQTITALSLIYALYSSPSHTHTSVLSSLVVSW